VSELDAPREAIAELRPTSWPLRFTRAPPELPGLIAASLWMVEHRGLPAGRATSATTMAPVAGSTGFGQNFADPGCRAAKSRANLPQAETGVSPRNSLATIGHGFTVRRKPVETLSKCWQIRMSPDLQRCGSLRRITRRR